jgi:hypothetical protein
MHMKAKLTRTNADPDDTNAWLAELHDQNEVRESDGILHPRGGRTGPSASLPRPYAGQIPAPRDEGRGLPSGHSSSLPAEPAVPRRSPRHATQRAVIGDELRRPVLWCQMGSCVTRFSDPDALGEADNRARAIGDGWREDAFARFACPACLQTSPEFRVKYPVVAWDKERALAMATLMAAAIHHYRHGEPADDTGAVRRAAALPGQSRCSLPL